MINLLPWRLWEHQKRLKLLGIRAALATVLSLLIYLGLAEINSHLEHQITGNKQQQESLQQEIGQQQQSLAKLRKLQENYGSEAALEGRNTLQFLDMLAQLPLQQGELSQVFFSAEGGVLKGFTEQQQEFHQIQQYLQQQKFLIDLQLSHFQPQENRIFFEFNFKVQAE